MVMRYKRIAPPNVLKNIVNFFWEFDGVYSESEPYVHGLTATINPKLAFQYSGSMHVHQNGGSSPLFRSGFQCQTTTPLHIVASQNVGIFGVYFHPFALPICLVSRQMC